MEEPTVLPPTSTETLPIPTRTPASVPENLPVAPEPLPVSPPGPPAIPPVVIALVPPPPPPKKASYGALISIILILLIVIVGAFYAWGQRIASERVTNDASPADTSALGG